MDCTSLSWQQFQQTLQIKSPAQPTHHHEQKYCMRFYNYLVLLLFCWGIFMIELIIIGLIMNISRLNYRQTLPFIHSTIKKAQFIAVDLQMSGIQTEQQTTPSILDSLELRYQKQRQSIHKFIPLQFGLSAFTIHPELNKIVAYPFNFHIFPLALPSDPFKFSFHAGTMTFLTKNNFDFNRLFYESIYFSRKDKLDVYKKDQNAAVFKNQKRRNAIVNSPEVKAFVGLHWSKVEDWLNSSQEKIEINIFMVKYQSYMTIQQMIKEKYPDCSLTFSFDDEVIHHRKVMTISKVAPEQLQQTKQQELAEEVSLFNEVMDSLIQSKKPLITHNGFLDLMHIYHRFVAQLPPDWTTYKHKLKTLFPNIYDNKYLFANSPTLNKMTRQRNTGLESCFMAMRVFDEEDKKKELAGIQLDGDFGEYSLDKLECHEAGFDALMTGYSFLRGTNILTKDLNSLKDPFQLLSHLDLYRNRIPQGGIKVPFNLQTQDRDIYVEDSNEPIYFQSVLHQSVDQEKVQQYFSSNFGPVNFFWTTRDMTNFCIIFINLQDKQTYEQHLTSSVGAKTSIICEIQEKKYLVRNKMEQDIFVNNHIQNQLTSKDQL